MQDGFPPIFFYYGPFEKSSLMCLLYLDGRDGYSLAVDTTFIFVVEKKNYKLVHSLKIQRTQC